MSYLPISLFLLINGRLRRVHTGPNIPDKTLVQSPYIPTYRCKALHFIRLKRGVRGRFY